MNREAIAAGSFLGHEKGGPEAAFLHYSVSGDPLPLGDRTMLAAAQHVDRDDVGDQDESFELQEVRQRVTERDPRCSLAG